MKARRDKSEVSLGLMVLDKQLIDAAGQPCGKIDDLEIEWPEPGSNKGPRVVAIITGPGGLVGRSSRRWGRLLAQLWTRLHPGRDAMPSRIEWRLVARVDSAVHLSVAREEAGLGAYGDWIRDQLIGRIPGA